MTAGPALQKQKLAELDPPLHKAKAKERAEAFPAFWVNEFCPYATQAEARATWAGTTRQKQKLAE